MVHGYVGMLEQGLVIPSVFRENGNADAGIQRELLLAHLKGLLQGCPDLGRHAHGGVRICSLQQHGELIATHARRSV